MPLPNRVAPDGALHAVPERGLLTGNRGCLHRADRTLGKARWRSKAWLCCRLDFRGRYHGPMPPGRWTALFFLDEVTALAAGHRPCAFCRRTDWQRFVAAWADGHGLGALPRTGEIDAVLHRQRVDPRTRQHRSLRQSATGLPTGAVIRGADGRAALLMGRWLLPWSFAGYGPARPNEPSAAVDVLTPPGSLRALAAGYRPILHPTARAMLDAVQT